MENPDAAQSHDSICDDPQQDRETLQGNSDFNKPPSGRAKPGEIVKSISLISFLEYIFTYITVFVVLFTGGMGFCRTYFVKTCSALSSLVNISSHSPSQVLKTVIAPPAPILQFFPSSYEYMHLMFTDQSPFMLADQ